MIEILYNFGLKAIETASFLWTWFTLPASEDTAIGSWLIANGIDCPMYILVSGSFLVVFLVFKIVFSLVSD